MLPAEVEYLWQWFVALSDTRQAGMAANPLTFSEIEAFGRLTLNRPTAWEVDVLRRLDRAVLGVWAANKATPTSGEPEVEAVPIEDTAGMTDMFRNLAAARPPRK